MHVSFNKEIASSLMWLLMSTNSLRFESVEYNGITFYFLRVVNQVSAGFLELAYTVLFDAISKC